METLRLRRIQEPSRVEALLDAYISRTGVLPDGAYQVRDRRELPNRVQTIVSRTRAQGHVWSGWALTSGSSRARCLCPCRASGAHPY